jgi:hypothetical protein
MVKQLKCSACAWVHFQMSRADAQASIDNSNAYADSKGEPRSASMENYLSCFRCGAASSTFVSAQPGDAPMLSTLQPVVIPEPDGGDAQRLISQQEKK